MHRGPALAGRPDIGCCRYWSFLFIAVVCYVLYTILCLIQYVISLPIYFCIMFLLVPLLLPQFRHSLNKCSFRGPGGVGGGLDLQHVAEGYAYLCAKFNQVGSKKITGCKSWPT